MANSKTDFAVPRKPAMIQINDAELFDVVKTGWRYSIAAREDGRKKRGSTSRGEYAMRELRLSKVYQLLEPGPVVLLTTAHNGRANVMTMSWHMMIEFEPPQVACVVSIAIPTRKLAAKVVKVGNSTGRDTDKFAAFELTQVPSARVKPPLIGECFANLECRVTDTRFVAKYNLCILEVVKAWFDPAQKNPKTIHHRGYGTFVVDGRVIHLKSRMR
jgi:flavin reductase (DIM6/NTAB) family NADH-FMN oxidoreductase RutF